MLAASATRDTEEELARLGVQRAWMAASTITQRSRCDCDPDLADGQQARNSSLPDREVPAVCCHGHLKDGKVHRLCRPAVGVMKSAENRSSNNDAIRLWSAGYRRSQT
jgi:hypothetical protein